MTDSMAHVIIDSTPSTFSLVGATPIAGENTSLNAYSGDVPMSPKTIPSAAKASAATRPPSLDIPPPV